jgi:transcriptional regulator with XRE-family HTH domain
MEVLGQILKDKRKKLNYSITEAKKATHIQEYYITAIEKGDISPFSADIYYRNFVRSYSKYLGIDEKKLIEDLDERKEFFRKEQEVKLAESVQKGIKWDSKKTLIVLISVLAFGVIFWYTNENFFPVYQSSKQNGYIEENFNAKEYNEMVDYEENTIDERLIQKTFADDFVFPENNKYINSDLPIDSYSSVVSNVNGLKQITNEVLDPEQELILESVSSSWISVFADDKLVFEGIMNNGDRKSFKTDDAFAVKVGYVPGIKVYFNGQQVNMTVGAIKDVNKIILKKGQKLPVLNSQN